ncbi:MAG: hypothetical protein ABSA11_10780 [Candidatus Bathyarchaeia archaeon]
MSPKVDHRRGVASIVGGVFLILIIISSYAFFIMSNRATTDLQNTISTQSTLEENKGQENLSINYVVPTLDKNNNTDGIILEVINSGSKPVTIMYIGVSDASVGIYNFSEPIGNQNLNPGEIGSYNVPISSQVDNYVIKLITSKGSIFSFSYNPSLTNLIPTLTVTSGIQDGQQGYILSGSNFVSGSTINVTITSGGNLVNTTKSTVLKSGLFSTYLTQLHNGTYTINAMNHTVILANTTLNVTPYLVLTPDNSQASKNVDVTIKGSGYPANQQGILIFFDSTSVILTDPITTNKSGAFNTTITVKGKSIGTHIITAQYLDYKASNIFTVLQ